MVRSKIGIVRVGVHPVMTILSKFENTQQQLFQHRIYQNVTTLEELKVFMESHVFAVWDFMSLLKRLQGQLAPVRLPWMPPQNREAVRFINEIVLCEESDHDYVGKPASHLDMYVDAMEEIGADTSVFLSFLDLLGQGDWEECLAQPGIPPFVQEFVMKNIRLSMDGAVEEVAANFLYGREDPIPVMFGRLLANLGVQETEAPRMFHYLNRHIEVDGGEHGPAATSLLNSLVQDDPHKQKVAEQAALHAVRDRICFWDGLLAEIVKMKETGQACR